MVKSPIEPEITAPSSDKISPNKFVVTITSNCAGFTTRLHRCVIYVEVICCDIWISWKLSLVRFYATNEKKPIHLPLSTDTTFCYVGIIAISMMRSTS